MGVIVVGGVMAASLLDDDLGLLLLLLLALHVHLSLLH